MSNVPYTPKISMKILGTFISLCFLGLFIGVSVAGALERRLVTIQLGSFSEAQNARQYKEHLKTRVPSELVGDLRIVHKPPYHAVRLGYFADRIEAKHVLDSFHGAALDVQLVEIERPSRMSAEKSQGKNDVIKQVSVDSSPLASDPVVEKATSKPSSPVEERGRAVSSGDHAEVAGAGDASFTENASSSQTDTQDDHDPRKADRASANQIAGSPSGLAGNLSSEATIERGKEDASSTERFAVSANPAESDNATKDPSEQADNVLDVPDEHFGSEYHVSLYLWGSLILMMGVVSGWAIRRRAGSRRIKTKSDKSNDRVDRHRGISCPLTSASGGAEEPTVHGADSAQPRLSRWFEKRLVKNTRELAMIEPNLLGVSKDFRVLYVSSCFAKEGKTTAALELSYGLAVQGGRKVLLVDWSDGEVSLTEYFSPLEHTSRPVGHGVKDFDVRVHTAYNGLDIMTLSRDARNCARLRKDEVMSRIALLRKEYDYIIADGQPVFGSCFTMYADIFDGVILVVEAEKTKWEVVQLAVDKLQSLEGRVVGTILNKRKFYLPKFLYGKI